MQCPYELKAFECNPNCKVWDEELKKCTVLFAYEQAADSERGVEERIINKGW